MRYSRYLALASAFAMASGTPQLALAFDGEDPMLGAPWHHQAITRDAAKDQSVGFSFNASKENWQPSPGLLDSSDPRDADDQAAESLAWHANAVDSYLSSPMWWAKGDLGRFKVVLSQEKELKKLNFNDLNDTNQVRSTWNRYAAGTFAGLLWAKEHDDVAAAQNIVGVSLHAIQDFYSHSNWIDAPARRDKTFLQIPPSGRAALPLYTGTTVGDGHTGVKPLGTVSAAASIFNQPGVKQLMAVACGPGSPFGNSEMCRTYEAATKGTVVRFNAAGIKIPNNVVYVAPAGISLDNTWMAQVGAKQRGLTDVSGEQAFSLARGLAVEASKQWLQSLETNMKAVGASEFWEQVKTTRSNPDERREQFENFAKMPYTFLSAGPYGSQAGNDDGWYLRVRLQTANDLGSGTDADIYLRADGKDVPHDGQSKTLLDYMPRSVPGLAYNDFEAGDAAVYVAGPFAELPKSIELVNDAANTGELLKSMGRTVINLVSGTFKLFGGAVSAITGKEADWIGTEHKVWSPEELAKVPTAAEAPGKVIKLPFLPPVTMPAGQEFTLESNGGDRGHYKINGYIVKTAESPEEGPEGWREFEVRLMSLSCIKESKWDRGSDSDEPFVLSLLKPLPGNQQTMRTEPFDGVDDGESRSITKVFEKVRVPKEYGMLNFAVSFMEHDDESAGKRDQLLAKFAGDAQEAGKDQERGLVAAAGAYVGADWKLQHINVFAWNRSGTLQAGTVLDKEASTWIKGRQSQVFNLDARKLTNTGLTTASLLPDLSKEPPVEVPPVHPTNNNTGEDEPDTPTQPDPPTQPDNPTDPDEPTQPDEPTNPTQPEEPTQPDEPDTPTQPNNPTQPNKPTQPYEPNQPNNPTKPNKPSTNGGIVATTSLGTLSLTEWDVQIDKIQFGRGRKLEVFATIKNAGAKMRNFTISDIDMSITDADGVTMKDNGNLYYASGEPGDEPEIIGQTQHIEGKETLKVRYLFNVPKGVTELKKLRASGYDNLSDTIDLPSIKVPKAK